MVSAKIEEARGSRMPICAGRGEGRRREWGRWERRER